MRLLFVVSTIRPMPRVDRGPNARKPTTVLLNDDERDLLDKALVEETAERAQDLGLGSKLRELGLLWARARREKKKAGHK